MIPDKDKNTKKLISALAEELPPVRPLLPPAKRTALWSAVFLAAMLLAVTIIKGFRHDLATVLTGAGFLAETAVLLFSGILCLYAGFKLSVPDIRYGKMPFAAVWVTVLLALGANIMLFLLAEPQHLHSEIGKYGIFHHCAVNLILLMAVPALLAFYLVRKSAPVLPLWTGYAVLLGIAAFAAAVMRLVCGADGFAHLLIWHFLPAFGLSFLGLLAGMTFLRW
ncbi:MAG: DUF1109 domain-containing protein [Pseudomonadota bacterium]|nr:DUF1109 domain-containing protein [Pseudomonadota bacterium]QKK04193.1 MAG: DUF1109 domain-containing protein [Pseudomonadota bacterium]